MASRVVLKEREDLFWVRVREGMSAAAACESVGVNRRQGYRWIKASGGRIPVPAVASSGRFLGQEERLRSADLRLGGAGVRAIARDLGRSASTISRELRRNSHPTTRSYRPYAAQKRCVIRAARPKPSKLDDRLLAAVVEERLRKNWSPQQISDDLAVVFAGQAELQVSHESLYQSLYVQSRGYVGVRLHRHLRRGRSARKRRGTQLNAPGKIRDKVMLSERPKEANDRKVTGVPIYFCDPASPWQRGSNENTNGLLRQYFPQGTDLNVHSAQRLLEVATELNERPRRTLKRRTPTDLLSELVSRKEIAPVASTV